MAHPDGAFARALEHGSAEWEGRFPGHCYICHVAGRPEDQDVPHDQVFSPGAGAMTCAAGCRGCAHEDDTSRCGPHCLPGRTTGHDQT